jgi:hypothetical protein
MEKRKYITIEVAAQRYGINPDTLHNLIQAGEVETIEVNGRLAVSENSAMLVALKERLGGDSDEPVSISEAARRLNINPGFVSRWVSYGWVPILGYGPRRAKMISFRRVQALAELQRAHGLRGRRLIPRGQEVLILS